MRLAIILLALSLPASAQVYKWTDENGQVHFGQRPPPASGAEHVPIGETNGALPPAEAYKSRPEPRRERTRASSKDIMCDYAKGALRRWRERWADAKSQGYTVGQENDYQFQIREAERYRDEQC